MFAVNDISLAADSNDFWAETTEQHRAYRKPRARMYFIQLIMSDVNEALRLIEEINERPALRAAVDQCDARTVENCSRASPCASAIGSGYMPPLHCLSFPHHEFIEPRLSGRDDLLVERRHKRID